MLNKLIQYKLLSCREDPNIDGMDAALAQSSCSISFSKLERHVQSLLTVVPL